MTRQRKIAGAAVGAALAGAAVLGVAGPASANLIAYDGGSYTGTVLANAPSAPVIDVADDRTSSIRNNTGSNFSARDTVAPGISVQIFWVGAGGQYGGLGSVNNRIDHFDRA